MTVVAGIQARLSSTRLPGKVLADLGGAPLIQRVVERVRAAERVDRVVVLTSTDPSDDALAAFLAQRGIDCRRGPLNDVLARYGALLDEFEPDYVVRVTGDCPLVEPRFIDAQVRALEAHDGDFVRVRPGVNGTLGGQTVMSARALVRGLASNDPLDREHVATFFFRAHAHEFRHVELVVEDDYYAAGLRLQVDEAPDLDFLRSIFARFAGEDAGHIDLREVLAWLAESPADFVVNASVTESEDNQKLRAIDRDLRIETVGRWP